MGEELPLDLSFPLIGAAVEGCTYIADEPTRWLKSIPYNTARFACPNRGFGDRSRICLLWRDGKVRVGSSKFFCWRLAIRRLLVRDCHAVFKEAERSSFVKKKTSKKKTRERRPFFKLRERQRGGEIFFFFFEFI